MFGNRMQIPRIWTVVFLMGILIFLVTACDGAATSEPSSPTSEPTESTESVEPSPEPTATAPAATKPAEDESQDIPSLNDIDINRDPGHSIGFERKTGAGETHRFLFLASPDDTLSVGLSGASDVIIGIQHTGTGQLLGMARSNEDPLFVTIPENALYHVVIEDVGGKGGEYVAAFEASSKVSFALDPQYFIIGRLPEGGLLYYTYTAPAGATLQGNVIPHPDTPVDLVVTVRELESQQPVFESDASGPGEHEPFTFTVPDNGGNQLQTFIVSVEDRDRHKGAYIFVVKSDAPVAVAPPDSPAFVVEAIFDAARLGEFAPLAELCDPLGENDADTQMICDVATDDANRDEFVQAFAKGKINGDVAINAAGDRAEVPFLFGPEADSEETMVLVARDGRWYLLEF